VLESTLNFSQPITKVQLHKEIFHLQAIRFIAQNIWSRLADICCIMMIMLCCEIMSLNWSVVHLPDDIWVWGAMVE
jgi:hypothetical protein